MSYLDLHFKDEMKKEYKLLEDGERVPLDYLPFNSDVNIIIGPNNSRKSRFFRFLMEDAEYKVASKNYFKLTKAILHEINKLREGTSIPDTSSLFKINSNLGGGVSRRLTKILSTLQQEELDALLESVGNKYNSWDLTISQLISLQNGILDFRKQKQAALDKKFQEDLKLTLLLLFLILNESIINRPLNTLDTKREISVQYNGGQRNREFLWGIHNSI